MILKHNYPEQSIIVTGSGSILANHELPNDKFDILLYLLSFLSFLIVFLPRKWYDEHRNRHYLRYVKEE